MYSMHQSIVTTTPYPRGSAGDSRENVSGFYFCIVPAVPGRCQGFVFWAKNSGDYSCAQ